MKRRTSGSRWRLLVHDAKGRALTKARHFASYPMRNLSPDLGEITHLPDTEKVHLQTLRDYQAAHPLLQQLEIGDPQ